jgi:hypothetical protein
MPSMGSLSRVHDYESQSGRTNVPFSKRRRTADP